MDKSILNKVQERLLILSPTVQAGLERECCISDFSMEGDNLLGKGRFGEVRKVIHTSTHTLYAAKIINKANIQQRQLVDQMNREIEIMYKVNHPHILRLINHFEDDENFYLLMPFASNGTLYSSILKHHTLDERTAAQYLREIILALQYLHSFTPQIIHRDIKPDNILIDSNGRIKLTDFGWANFKDKGDIRTTFCGTPVYIAPEMIRKECHDHRVDIWSLGVLLFEALAGFPPFGGSNQEELFMNIKNIKINWPKDFPPLARNLILKILTHDPKDRISLDQIMSHPWTEKQRPTTLTNCTTCPAKISTRIMNHGNEYDIKELISSLQKDNIFLTQANAELKAKLSSIENENQIIKIELLNITNLTSRCHKEEEEGQKKLLEELEKYKIIHCDRIGLLTEIDEKNNEMFDLKYKIRMLEEEQLNSGRTITQLSKRSDDQVKSMISLEKKIQDLEDIIQEKEEMIDHYQKRKEHTWDDSASKSIPNVVTVLETLNESINEVKVLFFGKISAVIARISEFKEELCKREDSFTEHVTEQSKKLLDLVTKFRNEMEEEITRIRLENLNYCRSNNMIEWLNQQINEVQQNKAKGIIYEEKSIHLQEAIKVLENKLYNAESLRLSLEISSSLKSEKLEEMSSMIEKLKAQLGDVKNFVIKNCGGQLKEFLSNFQEYYSY